MNSIELAFVFFMLFFTLYAYEKIHQPYFYAINMLFSLIGAIQLIDTSELMFFAIVIIILLNSNAIAKYYIKSQVD